MSTQPSGEAFVWTWLPGATEPVVAGRLEASGRRVAFTYGRSYLERPDAIPLYLPELPLVAGVQEPTPGDLAGCLADAGPDAWGRRVIQRHLSTSPGASDEELDTLTYLLESGSDRIGALDFQRSATEYVERSARVATLEELLDFAEAIQSGRTVPKALETVLLHGSSIGGARPKAILRDGDRSLIAKFSSTTDDYPVVQGEYVAMELAARAGLDVAPVELRSVGGREVLLVERFDRLPGGLRRAFVSALTILGLDELGFHYATYWELADTIRARFTSPGRSLEELFSRIVFNILTGNTDDHARNHGAFWDGRELTLTPAYDVCPQPRIGGEAAQAMAIGRDGARMSRIAVCIANAEEYQLTNERAQAIVEHHLHVITSEWADVCDRARLTAAERHQFWGRQFLNPYALEGY